MSELNAKKLDASIFQDTISIEVCLDRDEHRKVSYLFLVAIFIKHVEIRKKNDWRLKLARLVKIRPISIS